MPKKDTTSFINIISSNATKREHTYAMSYDLREICIYLESLSDISRKNIFSDSYWNRYPKFVYWKNHLAENAKAHGRGIGLLTKYISSNKTKYSKTYRSIIANSEGIILNSAINHFSGNDRVKLAKRGVKSNDPRVRKASVRLLPIKLIEHLADDSDWGIRSIVANRISPSARPDLFLNSKNYSARLEALIVMEPDRDTIFQMISERMSSVKDWQIAREITCLLDKLSDDDLLFFVNASGKQKVITDYFDDRLS